MSTKIKTSKTSGKTPRNRVSMRQKASTKSTKMEGSKAAGPVKAALSLPRKKPDHIRRPSIPPITGDTSADDAKVAEADVTKADYVALDQQVTQSQTFQMLWGIVKNLSAQTTFSKVCQVLEEESAPLIGATSVRFLMKSEGGLVRDTKQFAQEGIAGHVLVGTEIVSLVDPTQDPRYISSIDQDPTVGSGGPFLAVPVLADADEPGSDDKETFGVLLASKTNGESAFSVRDCTALFRLGEFAGNQLRSAARLEAVTDACTATSLSQKRSLALLNIAKSLGNENRLGPLVSLITAQVPELLDCDRCTLFFVDRTRKELIVTRGASHGRPMSFVGWVFGMHGAPELPFPQGHDSMRFPLTKGIAGHVGLTGETLNIPDAHQDPRFNPAVDKVTGYRTRSILCMPMFDPNGQIVGVLQAINKNPAKPGFSQDDEVLLQTFAAQAAVAVKNSSLFEQTQKALRKSEALLEVTNVLAKELKLSPLMMVIVAKVQALLRSQRCTVFLVDEEKKELYTSDAMSCGMGAALPIDHEKAELIRFPMDQGIVGTVVTTGKTIVIKDAYQDPRFDPSMDKKTNFHTKSILSMPIINHKGAIIGVTQVINKLDPAFDEKNPNLDLIVDFEEEDQALLRTFNAQASIAIENSRLYTQTERALNHAMAEQRNLKFLLGVTRNLFSDMHLSSMIEQMTMQVHHLLKADNCALYLVDMETKEFYKAKAEDGESQTRYPLTVGIVGSVAATGRTVRISKDAFKDPRFHQAVDQRKGHVTHSILCCPILAETSEATAVIGVISVRDEKDRGGFEKEEENLLKVFCAQAAVAIINSKRFTNLLDRSDFKQGGDHSAADYLIAEHGMQLAGDDIERFQYTMEEVQLVSRIGTGSYGEVYKARVRGKVVACKKLHVRTLRVEQVDSFCKEASLMCQLEHPNVVMFIGAVTEPQNLCIITEYCARGSLADLLLDPSVEISHLRKLLCAQDAARGMFYLHSSNPTILHRDLKSDNLLVEADWTVKVADFGLTRFLTQNKTMTQVGTPMWMAPEIIMGKQYTEKADVYAFGIIVWEILTRLEPYEDKEPMQIVVEVVNDDLRPTIPSKYMNDPLVVLMKDCWHPDPDERPTFKVIMERLDELVRLYQLENPRDPAIKKKCRAPTSSASRRRK